MSAQPLIDYLEHLQSKGINKINVSEHTRKILRLFHHKSIHGEFPGNQSTVKKPNNQTVTLEKQQLGSQITTEKLPEPNAKASSNSQFQQFAEKSASNPQVKALGTLRNTHIISKYPVTNSIVFVGCTPSYFDEKNKMPFSGPAGAKIDQIFKAMGIERKQVHLTNILKFRPKHHNQTMDTRSASEEEKSLFLPLFQEEMLITKPKIIVAMGEEAGQLLSQKPLDIDNLRGTSYLFNGIQTLNTFHPSLLLHTQETTDKRKFWEDMLRVMEIMNIPISEKQLQYFLPKRK